MELLETINKVFAYNLRRLRGERTQSEISEAADIPFRTYQRLEAGAIPKTREHLRAIARVHGCTETALFLDPDLLGRPPQAPEPTDKELLNLLEKRLAARVDAKAVLPPEERDLLALFAALDEHQAQMLLDTARGLAGNEYALRNPAKVRKQPKNGD